MPAASAPRAPRRAPTFYVLAGSCESWSADRLFRFNGTSPYGTWQQITPPVAGSGVGFGIFAVDDTDPNRLFVSVVTRPARRCSGP